MENTVVAPSVPTSFPKSLHFARINKRVANRIWTDLDSETQDIILNDTLGVTPAYKYFVNKVAADTERLYQDGTYWDNEKSTFTYPVRECPDHLYPFEAAA